MQVPCRLHYALSMMNALVGNYGSDSEEEDGANGAVDNKEKGKDDKNETEPGNTIATSPK